MGLNVDVLEIQLGLTSVFQKHLDFLLSIGKTIVSQDLKMG